MGRVTRYRCSSLQYLVRALLKPAVWAKLPSSGQLGIRERGPLTSSSFRNHRGVPGWLSGKESTNNAEDPGLMPGLGRSLGEENGNPL